MQAHAYSMASKDVVNVCVIEGKPNEDINAPDDDGWRVLSLGGQGWEYLDVVDNFLPPQSST